MKYHSYQGSHRYEVAEKPKTNKQTKKQQFFTQRISSQSNYEL